MPEQLSFSIFQQFLLLLAGPVLIGGAFMMWQVSRVTRGSQRPKRKRKRKRF